MRIQFTKDQQYGLNADELALANKYLRKQPNKKITINKDALEQMLDFFLLGYPYYLIQREFPQFQLDHIIFTGAILQWFKQRELILNSTHEKMKSRVASSMLNQIEFLSLMLQASNIENIEKLKKYIEDPKKNPKPDFAIKNLKEYQNVSEMLIKLAATPLITNPTQAITKQRTSQIQLGVSPKKQLISAHDEDDVEETLKEETLNMNEEKHRKKVELKEVKDLLDSALDE